MNRQSSHIISSRSGKGSASNKGEEPVRVVKVLRVRKAGQEGVKSEEMGRSESISGMGGRVGETMRLEEESEVEVIKKEGKTTRGKRGDSSRCKNQQGQSRNQTEKVVGDDKLGEREEAKLNQLDQQTNVLEESMRERQVTGLENEEIMWPDLEADRDDQLKITTSQNLESDIDAKLNELKLKSQSRRGGFEKEHDQDSQTSTAAVVEVEEMTSEDYYNDPLGHYAVHEEMLKDESRMLYWQQVSRFTTYVS